MRHRYTLVGIILILFTCASLSALAQPNIGINMPNDGYTQTKELALLYKKGLVREDLGSNPSAVLAYRAALARSQNILNKESTGADVCYRVFPFSVGSAYRLGIVTHRSIEGSVTKLYQQLQMYEDAEKWIDEVLTTISTLMLEKDMDIPRTQFGMIYYARAYNKIGWAYALFNGNLWKKYLVYTPANIMGMIDKQIADLKQMMLFYDIVYAPNTNLTKQIDEGVDRYFSNLKSNSNELFTLSLCYGTSDKEALKSMIKSQLKNVQKVIDLYNSNNVRNSLDKGRTIFTFEELNQPVSTELIKTMASLLNAMSNPAGN